jgi:glycosyltransferase involved in cell wall biosynthesis
MAKGRKLVVLVPAFNEEKTIASVVRAVPRRVRGIASVKVLVVDDGSVDRTAERAKKAGADKIVSHGVNRGLGRAFQTGMDSALGMGADLVVNIDADGQFNPRDIGKLIGPILAGKADVVTCSRFKDPSLKPKMPFIKFFGNRVFTSVINFFTRSGFTDTQCGFRAYSREAALRLNLFAKFTYTQEVLIDLLAKGLRIEEVACKVQGERKGESRVVKHWWTYGIKALVIVVRTLRDYKPLQFFGGAGIVTLGLGVLYGLWLWWVSGLPGVTNIPVWQVILAILLILAGLLLVVLALVADMLDRQRRLQEEILYRMKKKELS